MKLLQRGKGWIGILTVLALLCGLATVATAGNNYVYKSIDNEKNEMGTDITVMTYNVLDYVNTDVNEDYGNNVFNTRLGVVLGHIEAYEPDVIGIQEASNNNSSRPWVSKLKSNLSDTYNAVVLSEQSGGPSKQGIAYGLIIFYRKDRFTLQENGCANYTNTVTMDGVTFKPTDRWYQWAKLKDTEKNKTFYVFNTHLSINAKSKATNVGGATLTSAQCVEFGRRMRTAQAATLAGKINSLSKNYPCFATGDYNATISDSESSSYTEVNNQLGALWAYSYLDTVLRCADLEVMMSEGVDQIFVNTEMVDVPKAVCLQESVGGNRSSDHHPYVAYCNYRVPLSFGRGKYDKNARTLTDTVSAANYTFSVRGLPSGYTAELWDRERTVQYSSFTQTFSKAVNTYCIKIINRLGEHYASVYATVRYTGAERPALSVTAEGLYFSQGAYHIAVDRITDSLAIGVTGGKLYAEEGCVTAISGMDVLVGGVNTCYVKSSTTGDVYPVYIYKETLVTESDGNLLFVDDSFAGATGTVAHFDGYNVRLVKMGSRAYSSLTDSALVAKINAGGKTVYVAAGEYTPSTAFTAGVTLLGPNYNTGPFEARNQNAAWKDSPYRREEAVIYGGVRFALNGSKTTEKVTVKGFTFTEGASGGHIYLGDERGSNANRHTYELKMDITNNMFRGYETTGEAAGAFIWANNRSRKSGRVYNNLFECTAWQSKTHSSAIRGLTVRNVDGLAIESNRFLNIYGGMYLAGEHYAGATEAAGNLVYTLAGNRFEACGNIYNYVRNIRDGKRVSITATDNTFVRCGFNGATLRTNFTETVSGGTVYGNDFGAVSINITRNRFFGCGRSIGFYRDAGSGGKGDLRQAKVKVNENIFYQPTEGKYSSSIVDPFVNVNSATIVLNMNLTAASGAASLSLGSNWSLAYNYFYSDRVKADHGSDATNPKHYTSTVCTYNGQAKSFSDTNVFSPYYTTYSGTQQLGGLSGGSIKSFADGDIVLHQPTVAYDGQPHSISLTLPDGATAVYSTNAKAGDAAAYTADCPTYTLPGTYKLGVRVTAPGYTPVYYQNVTLVIEKGARTDIPQDKTVDYSGAAQSLSFTPMADDTVIFTYDGKKYTEMPTFVNAGSYKVTVTATNPLYADLEKELTLTVLPAALPEWTCTGGYSGVYDGIGHKPNVRGLPEGVVATYSVGGGAYSETLPVFTDVTDGEIVVSVRPFDSSGNYIVGAPKTVSYNITPATLRTVSLRAAALTENGREQEAVIFTGKLEGDTLRYRINEGEWKDGMPMLVSAGRYAVEVELTRKNFKPVLFRTTVTVAMGSAPELLFTFAEPQKLGGKYLTEIGLSERAMTLFTESDIKLVEVGLVASADASALQSFVYYTNHGSPAQAEALRPTLTFAPQQREAARLYEKEIFTAPLGASAVAVYITYEKDGELHTECSAVLEEL